MKVAHLWYVVPFFGGAETWAIGLSKALVKLGVESKIVCWGADEPQEHQELFRVFKSNVSPSPDIIDALMNGAFMAERLEDYDLICCHHNDVIFPAVFSKSLHGSQVACMLHDPPMGWRLSEEGLASYRYVSEGSIRMNTVWKMFMHYSDLFFTNSRWNQKLYEKYDDISPVPLLGGVDHDVFKPDKRMREIFREKMRIDEATILLFYSSAAGRRKRHEILLRGLRTLVRSGYNVKCVLTCSKDRRSKSFHPLVERIIQDLGLEQYVLTFPATSDEVLRGLYNACDIYVHPANNEHLGMAIMEAMAVGKPVVAQANGGVPEILENDVEGFCFKTDSVDHIVKCIEKLITDKDLRERMGNKALEKSMSFSWQEVATHFLETVS
jgi:glycosyltransferase involved in cell wall biosynthesis